MIYAVYPLRRYGEKLHPDDVRSMRRVGELTFIARRWHPAPRARVMCAQLLDQDGETYVLPLLDRAWIEIRKKGILIQGTELIPVDKTGSVKNIKCYEYRQSWYCMPAALEQRRPSDASPAASRASAKRLAEIDEHRLARAIGQSMTDPHVRRSR